MARDATAELLIELIPELQGPFVGLSLGHVREHFGISHRTAERMRDAVCALFPELKEHVLDDRVKRPRLLEEMAFHAFTWGGLLKVLEPKELRELLREMAEGCGRFTPEIEPSSARAR